MSDFRQKAVYILQREGYLVDESFLDTSGRWASCPTVKNPRKRNGHYKIHCDNSPVLVWHDWTPGGTQGSVALYEGSGYASLSIAEQAAQRQEWQTKKERDAIMERQRLERGRQKAWETYQRASRCTSHPYLDKKGLLPIEGMCVDVSGNLLIPIRDIEGRFISFCIIYKRPLPDGRDKGYATGAPKRGGFFALSGGLIKGIAWEEMPIAISEGVATAISIRAATGFHVACAFDCHNLVPVAEAIRGKYPSRTLIIGCDNDCDKPENAGLDFGTKAAKAVNAFLCVPELNGQKCDFDDVRRLVGCHEVRRQFEAVVGRIGAQDDGR